MNIIAIDPGLRSGVAVFRGAELMECIEVSPIEIADTLDWYAHSGLDQAVIEDQYPGRDRAWKSVRRLVEIAGYWSGACIERGVRVEKVMASRWQSSIRTRGMGRANRAQLKRMSREVALARWGEKVRDWTENQCDAANMGWWWIVENRMEKETTHGKKTGSKGR